MAYAFGKFDGILGLGFNAISVDGVPTFMDEMCDRGLVKDCLFAFYLSKTDGVDGELTFGYIDESRYTGPISWVNLSSKDYWQVTMDNLSTNGSPITTSTRAILDSGTSLLAGPTEDVKAWALSIGASAFNERQFIIDCDADLPDLNITIGGKDFVLTGKEYIIDVGGVCLFGAIGLDTSIRLWILGDVFLRKYYSIHDLDNGRVGLALAV